MTNYLLRIEYDGTPYCGWQRQNDVATVQGSIETALKKATGETVTLYGAGRTDAGVHATGQTAHAILRDDFPARKVADALNYHLRPDPIAILSAQPVDDDFHARFDATERRYRYIIENRRAQLTFDRDKVWRVAQALDADKMQRAAQALIGLHDFSTFRDVQCQSNSPVKTLDEICAFRSGSRIELTFRARSFLHRQVRSIVGSLVEVGRGAQSEDWISTILTTRDRKACGPVAPCDGLYLEDVIYDRLSSSS